MKSRLWLWGAVVGGVLGLIFALNYLVGLHSGVTSSWNKFMFLLLLPMMFLSVLLRISFIHQSDALVVFMVFVSWLIIGAVVGFLIGFLIQRRFKR